MFCSFNASYKITPAIFDIWMRLLTRIDQSVLWIGQASEPAQRNLKREAELRAALAIAKLYGATGRGSNISEVLAPALEGFAGGSDLNEVAEANRMLARVAVA